jgi:hypothetical protein
MYRIVKRRSQTMEKTYIQKGYSPLLNLYDTQKAIDC